MGSAARPPHNAQPLPPCLRQELDGTPLHAQRARGVHVSRFQLRLLRSFGLFVEGSQVVLPPSAERLIAFLAFCSPAERRTTSGILWSEASEARAAGSLRSTLSKLQRICPSVVVNTNTKLSLSTDVETDVLELRRVAGEAMSGTEHMSDTVMRLVEIGGELLPTWDEEWLYFEREQLRQIRIQSLECVAARLCGAGYHGTAMLAASEAVRLEPLRESAQRQVIAIHIAQGNQAQAIAAYRSFAARLWCEYKVRPSSLLTQLVQDLGDPLHRRPGAPGNHRPTRGPGPPGNPGRLR